MVNVEFRKTSSILNSQLPHLSFNINPIVNLLRPIDQKFSFNHAAAHQAVEVAKQNSSRMVTISIHEMPVMPKITLEVSEELSTQVAALGGDRLSEALALGLRQSVVPSEVYRYVLDFLTSNPTAAEIADFRPTTQMQERLRDLLDRSYGDRLTSAERHELDEYERIEHCVVMLKAGNLSYLSSVS